MNFKKTLRPALAPALLALVAGAAHAGPFVNTIPMIDVPVAVNPVLLPSPVYRPNPMTLPSMPIQIPSIGGPSVRLPSPILPIPTLPGAVIRMADYRAAQAPAAAQKADIFTAAKKSFASNDGSAPSAAKLNTAFDNAKAVKAEAADDEDEPEVKVPAKRRGDPYRHTLPESDLLIEIGIH